MPSSSNKQFFHTRSESIPSPTTVCRFAAADLIIVSSEVSLMQMCGSELIILLSHSEGPVKD